MRHHVLFLAILLSGCTVDMYDKKTVNESDLATIVPGGAVVEEVDSEVVKHASGMTSIRVAPGTHYLRLTFSSGTYTSDGMSRGILFDAKKGKTYIATSVILEDKVGNKYWKQQVQEKESGKYVGYLKDKPKSEN